MTNNSNYQVLVYAPFETGHHGNFAKLIASAVSMPGVDACFACPSVVEQLVDGEMKKEGRPSPEFLRIESLLKLPPTKRLKRQMADIYKLSRQKRWDRILIPSADGLLQAAGGLHVAGIELFPKSVPVEALSLRGGVAYPGDFKTKVRRTISWRVAEAAPIAVRYHLDPVFVAWHRNRKRQEEWNLMPDPIERLERISKEDARRRLGLPTDVKLFGTIGILDERKGVDHLIEAFSAGEWDRDTHMLLAGECGESIRRMLPGAPARVHVFDQWLSDDTLASCIGAMDLVTAVYPNHVGSSSVVLRAMAAGRPVLGSETPWMEAHLQKFGGGWICSQNDSGYLGEQIREAIEMSVDWKPSKESFALINFNSPRNFIANWQRNTADDIGFDVQNLPVTPPRFF